jgi:hypothetical protein
VEREALANKVPATTIYPPGRRGSPQVMVFFRIKYPEINIVVLAKFS